MTFYVREMMGVAERLPSLSDIGPKESDISFFCNYWNLKILYNPSKKQIQI